MSIEYTIPELQKIAHRIAKDKGWYDDNRTIGEVCALVHSEISEALECYRRGQMDMVYENGKPEGFPVELADAVIRILDTCEHLNIDLNEVMYYKMLYNKTRSYRHGDKKI